MAGAGNQPNHMRARRWHGHHIADGHTGLALSAVTALVTALSGCGGSASATQPCAYAVAKQTEKEMGSGAVGLNWRRGSFMSVRRWSVALVTSCILACVGVGFGVAQASIPDSSGVIHACYNVHGLLRVIDGSAQGCRKRERGISWPSTAAAGLTGWQLIQCTISTDSGGNVTVSGSPLCSGGSSQATILCPPGKVAIQEAGNLLGAVPGADVIVNADGSGAVFGTGGANTLSGESIQLVCADGST
jgi:hypothetical protein